MVGTITYDIYLAGGWCAYSGAGATWGNGSATTSKQASRPIAYFIAVKVAWGPDAATANPTSSDKTTARWSNTRPSSHSQVGP